MKRDKLYIAKNLTVVSGGTLVSRVLGFIRDMVIANYFGTSLYADAFFVAFRIPNLFRRLLGEGALTASFVPCLSEFLEKEGKSRIKEVLDASFTLLFVVLVFLVVLGEVFSPWIVKLVAPGFSGSAKFGVSVSLLRAVFPYILFISLVALCMGFLNTLGHFFAPSIGPSLLNLSIILCTIFAYRFFHPHIFVLALGVVVGGVLQLFFQLPFLKKETGHLPSPTKRVLHPVVKESSKLMAPAFLGLAASQLNIFVGTILASFLPTGAISFLYYADRLFQFPLGVFSIALGTVVLPLFSKSTAKGKEGLEENLLFSMKLSMFISIPAAVGLIFLNIPIISSLFLRGRFDVNSMVNTGYALIGYSLGIPAFSGARVIIPGFYSMKDTKTPFYTSFITLFVNAGFGILFLHPLKHFGLALANSIASWANFFALFYLFERKFGAIKKMGLMKEVGVTAASCVPVAALCFAVYRVWFGLWYTRGMFLEKVSLVMGSVVACAAVFFLVSWFMGSSSVGELLSLLKGGVKVEKDGTQI